MGTDHTKALADVLERLQRFDFECRRDGIEPLPAEVVQIIDEALDAYRASEQASTAVELPTPVRLNHPRDIDACREALPVFGYTAEQLTAYGDARTAEARRAALNNEQRAGVHAAIRALITKE